MRVIRIAVIFALLMGCIGALQAQEYRYFDSAGVRIRYLDEGRGEPLILLHGNANRIESWNGSAVLAALGKQYRVIRFDARGHGESGKPHDPKAYGVEMGLEIGRAHV